MLPLSNRHVMANVLPTKRIHTCNLTDTWVSESAFTQYSIHSYRATYNNQNQKSCDLYAEMKVLHPNELCAKPTANDDRKMRFFSNNSDRVWLTTIIQFSQIQYSHP